jgi:pyruvate,water dikinase
MEKSEALILWFDQLGIDDVGLVGGKNASLGEMYRNLTQRGVNVPNGFAITAKAYRYVIEQSGAQEKIKQILGGLDTHNVRDLEDRGRKIREIIRNCEFPDDLKQEIMNAYRALCNQYNHSNVDVAVRSSATAEDLPSISTNEHVLARFDGDYIYDKVQNIFNLISDMPSYNLEVPVLKDNRLVWGRVSELYRHKSGKTELYKITTRTGRNVTLSRKHSLIALSTKDFKIHMKSLDEIDQHDYIPVIKKLPLRKADKNFIEARDYLVKGKYEIDSKQLIRIRASKNYKVQNPLPNRIQLDEDFAYFLGIYAAEGSTYKTSVIITSKDKDIQKKVIKFFNKLGVWKGNRINKHSIRVYCPALVDFLHAVCGMPTERHGKGKLAYSKKVPDFIFSADENLIGAFLAGCFDGDGYASRNEISYSSVSEMLLGGIIKLLETLGIGFTISKDMITVRIILRDAEKFSKIVKLANRNKLIEFKKLLKKYTNTDKHFDFLYNYNVDSSIFNSLIFENAKEKVQTAVCVNCKNRISKSSKYKNKIRYYCKNCHRAYYCDEISSKYEKKYVDRDEKGRFKQNMMSWNKGILNNRYSIMNLLGKIAGYEGNSRKIKEIRSLFTSDVMWESIKHIEKIDYDDFVYDFVVPGAENFASGVGGIITHNTASFAGQQETYLNIKGELELIEACKKCFASLFTNRAISYRVDQGFDHFKVYLSIGVQKMVRSDLSCSGVMFTIDTESGFKDAVLINAAYGLGENVVQGAVNPDQYYVFKPKLKEGFKPILQKMVGSKKIKMVYSEEGGKTTKNVFVPDNDRKKYVLTDDEIFILAKWGAIIEDYYSQKRGKWTPMDTEWAKDGVENKLYIVQARPETVQSQKNLNVLEEYILEQKAEPIVVGHSVGDKIGQGPAHIIKDVKNISEFAKGQVLITDMTDPDWEPAMKNAAAIVTNRGGRTCHAAIISREFGIPCVVGTNNATEIIKKGQNVTVSCAEGEEGFVYDGLLRFRVDKIDLQNIPKTKTKIMMNVGNPDQAFNLSFIPNQGVGLAREEFIINSYVKIHPRALLEPDKVRDANTKKTINKITFNYDDKLQFYVDELARGVATIAAAYYPKDVIVRMSDFKSNEYANLIGGKYFEPDEDNPMIGFRGASRYYSKEFRASFALECRAMKKVRDEMGLTNVKIMIPFCRTVDEGKKVLQVMEENGLKKGENDLQVYVMCEIPSNVILADQFSEIFDGFSIGTNDLTQLTLGLDRDSELVAHIYDERNEAVKQMVKTVIERAKAKGRKIGICGDAPSTYPEFARFLVECGIDSISLSPDAVIKTTLAIAEEEKRLGK